MTLNPVQEPVPWIKVCDHAPYFEESNGKSWTPIGQNDAITWPDFQGLFLGRNPEQVEGHLAYLARNGVTCVRMMMEYCQTENRYLEKPVGRFQPNMIRFWDDMFLLCRKYRIRILLTPFDTFWMARRWKYHPYNKISGGPCSSKWQWLTSPAMLEAIKIRFDFFIERYGACGTLFGWDLWNEISPLNAGKQKEHLVSYIEKISVHIREKETALFGKCHLQTVSVFAPTLSRHDLADLIFRHPMLDFATTHFYDAKSIDYPKNTWTAALKTGKFVQDALNNCSADRPFLDTEHGPISYFKKHRRGLPEAFDDTYFLYMQWSHFASGGAGGGMRWPYRYPHVLTHGMRKAQLNLSQFTALIHWKSFKRRNISDAIQTSNEEIHVFGCGDKYQAVVWLLRVETKSVVRKKVSEQPQQVLLKIPGLGEGVYEVHLWNTHHGSVDQIRIEKANGDLEIQVLLFGTNLAIAIKQC